MIFLMATDVVVNWSFAEQTRPNAPIPTGCRSTYRVVTSKTVPKMDNLTKSMVFVAKWCTVKEWRDAICFEKGN